MAAFNIQRRLASSNVRGLLLTPSEQRVVQREFQFELAVIVRADEREAIGDGDQPGALRRTADISQHVGPVHDASKSGDGRVGDVELFDQAVGSCPGAGYSLHDTPVVDSPGSGNSGGFSGAIRLA